MLYIMGGLPGAGKSTLSRRLAAARGAVHLRIDTIEQAMREAGAWQDGPAGYAVAGAVARDNLRLGLDVVADSVNPLAITREAWRDVAHDAGSAYVEVEVICSAAAEHRRRVEERLGDVPGLRLPTWQDVMDRSYEAWSRERLVLDTAGKTPDESFGELLELLGGA